MGITKDKGNLAEIKVAAFLIEKGFKVLVPWGENNRYDLVAEKENKFLRIQVKYVSPKKGRLSVPLRSANNWKIIKYNRDEIDVVAAYNPDNDNVYLLLLKDFPNTATINLRISTPKNGQKRGVIPAVRFENKLFKPL